MFASVFLLGCIDFSGGGPNTDKIKIIGEENSPNGKFIATSFSCSGGGAAGYFYFNANLRKAGEKLDQRDGLNLTSYKRLSSYLCLLDDIYFWGYFFSALLDGVRILVLSSRLKQSRLFAI